MNNSRMTQMPPTIASRFRMRRPNASRQTPLLRRDVTTRSIAPAVVAIQRTTLAVADAGVDVRVKHVNDDIQERNEESVQDGHRHDQAVVPLLDAQDVILPDARDAEEVLDDERACHEEREDGSQDRHDRDERVPDHVPDDDRALADALALGGPDI